MDIRTTGNIVQTPVAFADKGLPVASGPALPVKSVTTPAQPVAAVQQPSPQSTDQEVGRAIQKINKAVQAVSQNLEFSIDEDDRTIVKVVDSQSREVIRQMPTQEALEIAKALDRAQGMLIHQKA